MTIETPGEHAEQAASVLGPGLLADPDGARLGPALGQVLGGALRNPAELARAWARYSLRLAQIPSLELPQWIGDAPVPPVPLNPKDKRFADRAWSDDPAFSSLRMSWQAFAELLDEMVSAAGLDQPQEAKARLLTGLLVDALPPTNFLLTNPAALKRLVEPAEVAELAVFLCGPRMPFANGSSYVLDGGWTAR